jgi:uncharacterized protein
MPAPDLPALRADRDGCVLVVHVLPRAHRTEVDGWRGEALRVRLAAAPVDGQANDALVAWLAESLALPRRAVRVQRGQTSRHKQLRIDAPAEVVAAWLRRAAPPGAAPAQR